jgi:SAM-dependent methyltransferase
MVRVWQEELCDTVRYLETHKDERLEDKRAQYEGYLRPIRKFRPVDARTRMLEVGTGTGWFPTLAKMDGLRCTGLEISPQLIEFARERGRKYGVEPDIELGNLEATDLGESRYDVIIASNIFEHVEYWRKGVANLYRALTPGGAMFFESTNRFSFVSGEWTHFPLYGWWPDWVRYRVRIRAQGPDIMKLGIDFHQFTHGVLRREFERAGFSRIYDRIEIADEEFVSSRFRRTLVSGARRSRLVKALALTFADVTRFVCVK